MESEEVISPGADDELGAAASAALANPSDAAAWDALEELAAASGQPDDVSKVYRDVLGGELGADVAADVAQRAVNFHEEWYSESSPVLVEVLSRVLEVDPSASVWAFQRLTVVHTVAERWDDLLALYDTEIARTPDTHRRATLLEEAAQTAKDFASAPDRAAAYLLELFELRPKDRALASSLERLLERQERYADLVRLWRSQALQAEAEEAQGLRLRIAEALFDRLEQPGDAIGELKELLDTEGVDPDGPMEMLERIVRDERVDPDARRQALTILREAYDASGRTTEVIGTLDTALRLASDDERVALHRDAATRLRDAGDFEGAVGHLASLVELSPGDDEALEALREIAPKTESPDRIVEVLVVAADAASDPVLGAKRRLEAIDLLAERGDLDRAITQMAQVAGAEGTSEEFRRSSMRRYATLLEQAERSEERLDALERLAAVEDTRSAQREALKSAARLAQQLEQPDRAIGAWEKALEVDPKDSWALEEIIAILRGEGRHEALVEALRRRADSGVPDFQRRTDLAAIANVQANDLELVADAIATWNEIGAAYGEDAEVTTALVELYGRAERWTDQAEVLERAAAKGDAHIATLRAKQGETFATQLGDRPGALRSYRRALEADQSHDAARDGLLALSEDPEVGGQAVEALARSYEASGDWEAILRLLDKRLEATDDVGRQLELLEQAASLQLEKADAPAAALEAKGRALVLAPGRLRLEADVANLMERTEDWSAGAHAFGAAAGAVAESDAERAGHLKALESDIRSRSGDAEGAFQAAIVALAHRPLRVEEAERVLRLADDDERTVVAEAALREAASGGDAPDALLQVLADVQRKLPDASTRLAETLDRLSKRRARSLDELVERIDLLDDDAALESAYRALYDRGASIWRSGEGEGDAAETQCLRAAGELASRLDGDPEAASRFLAGVSRLPMEASDAADWLRRAAQKAQEAGDPLRAMALYREVLERGEDADSLAALSTIYLEQGRSSELLDLRRRELGVAEDAERRVELRLDIARLVTEVEEKGGRLEALRENLRERPGHAPSLAALEHYLTSRRDYAELADVLEAQAAQLDGERASGLWSQVASIAEEHLGATERALEAHRRVVELEPEHVASLDALARIQQGRGEAAAASRWLERRLTVASGDERADVAMNLAATLLEAGRVERACEVLEAGRAEFPARADMRALLAEQYRQGDRFAPLAKVLADSAELTEDREEVLSLVREAARLYRDELSEPSAAIPVLRKARDLAPDDREIELMLAEGLRHAGEHDEARTILEKVIADFGRRRSAERAQVHYDLAIVARAQGDLDGALEQLDLASKMAAAQPRVLQMLGRMAREAGQLDRAEKAYRALLMTVRRASSDTLDVGSAEVLYELHALARDRGEEDQAEELRESALEAAAQSDAEAFRFRDNLASRGEEELVLAALDRRVEVAPEPASKAAALAAMANVLEAQGRREEAAWRRMTALEHAPGDESIHEATLAAARVDGDVAPYVEKVEAIIESRRRENDAATLATLFVVLGNVKEVDQNDLDEATNLYGRAEGLLETPVRAWTALARVGAAREDIALQRRVLTKLVDAEGISESVRADSLHQLAGIQLRDTASLDDGVKTARRAFDLDPRHAGLAAALEHAAARAEDVELMRLYEEVARDGSDDE
ncbi:MAG: tetratricopeptide repeat protein, partial [Myxococcota bacterium]